MILHCELAFSPVQIISKKISYWLSPVVGLRRLSHGLFSLGRTGKTCLGDHRDLNQTDFHLHLCQFCTSSSQVAILAAWRRQSTLQKMKGKQLKLTHARAGHVYSSPDGLLRVWCFQLAAFSDLAALILVFFFCLCFCLFSFLFTIPLVHCTRDLELARPCPVKGFPFFSFD